MKTMLRRARAALGMGLIWSAGGLAVGGLIELLDNVMPAAHGFTRQVDMWPQLLAMLAFPCGVVFAVVLLLAKGNRRFEDFSLPQFAGFGALAGVVAGGVVLALGAGPAFIILTTLLSALGGAASLALARMAEGRGLLGGHRGATELEPDEGESRHRLGDPG